MEELTLKMPKKMFIELINQLSPNDIKNLLQKIKPKIELKKVSVDNKSLSRLNGIISVGGDALIDTETIYE